MNTYKHFSGTLNNKKWTINWGLEIGRTSEENDNAYIFFSTSQLRKRNPSPTPSAVSSTSSALSNGDKGKSPLQPKFGKKKP